MICPSVCRVERLRNSILERARSDPPGSCSGSRLPLPQLEESPTTTAANRRASLPNLLRAAAAAFAILGAAANLHAANAEPRRVLIVTSFGSRFAPFETYAAALRAGIVDGWGAPVEFLETPLEIARFASPREGEGPLADYLRALVANHGLNLVVTIGGPAADFVSRQHPFPGVPTLLAGLERRQLTDLSVEPNEVVVATVYDSPRVVENVLRLFPGTTRFAVVFGASPLERFWKGELERELAPFISRGEFEWWDDLPLEEMRRRAAALGPGSAILYGSLKVDAAGIVHEEQEGLVALRAVSKVPIIGGFTEQLGYGIVGGPLVPISREARRAADVALRLLAGESPAHVTVPPVVPLVVAYDWRELQRFHVPESVLPAGSEVRFRPSLWDAHRTAVLITFAVVLLQALLIAALLAERGRRRRAEERVHVLNRRLVHAQEEERKLIARELHDDFSQRLARLAIDAARLEYSAAVPVEGRPAPMRDELTRLSEDAHALAYQLHPSTLEDLGLSEALRNEAERFTRLESVPVTVDIRDGSAKPSRETALCLFRIAQEGLRNVSRHAQARSVTVSCAPSGRGLELRLRDDGNGFDPDRRRERPSLGLASMRERVETLGGRLAVRSAPGQGTEISVWAPLEPRPL
jgi:signal transduction histidine kinase